MISAIQRVTHCLLAGRLYFRSALAATHQTFHTPHIQSCLQRGVVAPLVCQYFALAQLIASAVV